MSEPSDWERVFGHPAELINAWEDWFQMDRIAQYVEPTYSPAEAIKLRQFHVVWDRAADAISNAEAPFDLLLQSPHWQELARSARSALAVFAARGKLSEQEQQS